MSLGKFLTTILGQKTLDEIFDSLVELVLKLSERLDSLDERFNRIELINKKINEIRTLNFPKDALEKEKDDREIPCENTVRYAEKLRK